MFSLVVLWIFILNVLDPLTYQPYIQYAYTLLILCYNTDILVNIFLKLVTSTCDNRFKTDFVLFNLDDQL